MVSDTISVDVWETLIASALAVVIAVGLVLLIVRMVRHAEVDVTSDFEFSGTPDDDDRRLFAVGGQASDVSSRRC